MGEEQSIDEKLAQLASVVRDRNAVDAKITSIVGRPAQTGHVGEFIAAAIFDIDREHSACSKGWDGRFRSGPLSGKTVNIKWYPKRQQMLDININHLADYYLVLTGPFEEAVSSRGKTRPWTIRSVYLFQMRPFVDELTQQGLKSIAIATSVANAYWQASEIYPQSTNSVLVLDERQRRLLRLVESE